jgi:uncharacterized protein HemX
MNNKNIIAFIVAIVAVLVVATGGYWFYMKRQAGTRQVTGIESEINDLMDTEGMTEQELAEMGTPEERQKVAEFAEKIRPQMANIAQQAEQERAGRQKLQGSDAVRALQAQIQSFIAMHDNLAPQFEKLFASDPKNVAQFKQQVDSIMASDPLKAEKEKAAQDIANALAALSKDEILAVLDPFFDLLIPNKPEDVKNSIAIGAILQELKNVAATSNNPDLKTMDEWIQGAVIGAIMGKAEAFKQKAR